MTHRFDMIHACVSEDEPTRAGVTAFLAASGRAVEHVSTGSLASALDAIDVLLCGTAPRIDWSRARRLKLVQLMGSGIDALGSAAGLPLEVEIANARGIHLPEMRDHVLAMLLAFERDLPRLLAQQRARRWCAAPAGSLSGKTVTLLGLGEVGRAVAAACGALGMRVVGMRAGPRPTPHVDEVHGPEALDRVLAAADYAVVLLPLTARTHGLLDARALSVMRHDAVLVHVSRGGIVDEAALSTALAQGRMRGAALDVFEHEPLSPQSPLWDTPNLIVTPHVAGLVRPYFERALTLFLDNVERVERGQPPRTRVDRLQGY